MGCFSLLDATKFDPPKVFKPKAFQTLIPSLPKYPRRQDFPSSLSKPSDVSKTFKGLPE